MKLGSRIDAGAQRSIDFVLAAAMNNRNRALIATLLLVVNLCLMVVFLFAYYKGYFHSDASVRVLLAEEMHETGRFFPSGWNYVNKDLMILFAQLGVWPLQFFFDSSYTLYAVTGVAIAALILLSLWSFSGLLEGEAWQRILAIAVIAGGVSKGVEEDIFGQAAYGILLMLTCVSAIWTWRSMAASVTRRPIWWMLLFALLTLCTWSNPQRAAASYLLPLYCGLAAYLWGGGWRARIKTVLPVIGISVMAFVAGSLLSLMTLAEVNNNAGAGAARWLSFNSMADNVVHTLHGVIALLGGVPAAGGGVISGSGVYAAIRMVAALVLIVLMIRCVVRMCGSDDERSRFIGGLVGGLSICFLFLQATTTVADMVDPESAARYLTPAVTLALLLVVCSPLKRETNLVGLLVMGLGALLATNSIVRVQPNSMVYGGWTNVQRDELVQELQSMGLNYGYASYWNSGAITVLSAGDVKVRQIHIVNGLPVPMRHLSSDRWYEPEAWNGESFLLLTDTEAAALNWGALTRAVGAPIRQARIGDKQVFVFARNISHALPGWSLVLRNPLRIDAGPDGLKTVGRWIDADQVLRARAGDSGFLQYGPYMMLGKGRYKATFDVTGSDGAGVVAKVDVVAAGGAMTLGAADIMADGKVQRTIEFALDRPVPTLELRVVATGAGSVDYKGVSLSAVR